MLFISISIWDCMSDTAKHLQVDKSNLFTTYLRILALN